MLYTLERGLFYLKKPCFVIHKSGVSDRQTEAQMSRF